MRHRATQWAVVGAMAVVGPACGGSGSGTAAQTGPGATPFGLGRPATADEIAAWDIDIMPDGQGLPDGRGTVSDGRTVYVARCAWCHGATGTEGPFNRLVGRVPGDSFPFATDPTVPLTVGNYWPYATTLFDYIRRTMPFDAPGSLTDDEVYALSAYILHLNDLLPADTALDRTSLPTVRMPAHDRFVPDDREGGRVIR